jgi:nucleoside-diphosphate-sugar epimerase
VHSSERLKHSAYNIGGGQHLTYGDIADKAAALFPGLDIALEDGTSSHDWPGSTLDISRAHADAGYRPAFSIEQAMEGYASWLREGHAF